MHFWIWLNEPQHGTAIQALAALIFGIPTLLFLAAATVAAWRQAEAGRAQTEVGRAQIELASTALREEARPVLSLSRENPSLPWRDRGQRLMLANTGRGAALKTEVELFRGVFDKTTSLGTYFGFAEYVVPPGQTLLLAFPAFMAYSILVVYESSQKEAFASSISFPDGELRVAYAQNTAFRTGTAPFRYPSE